MAKGSVRKKGKKWYYRFYVEDASGNLVQKEYAGTESKSETEKLLRQAMDDYESKKFVAKTDNLTVGELLDMWAEEELKVGTLSNGTVENYLGAIRCIKKHPIAERKLKSPTPCIPAPTAIQASPTTWPFALGAEKCTKKLSRSKKSLKSPKPFQT